MFDQVEVRVYYPVVLSSARGRQPGGCHSTQDRKQQLGDDNQEDVTLPRVSGASKEKTARRKELHHAVTNLQLELLGD